MHDVLLQRVTALLLPNAENFYYITRQLFFCKTHQFCYKMQQVLQNALVLLQNTLGITKYIGYYKTGIIKVI